MNSNSENPKVGKKFQLTVKEWFEKSLNCEFDIERKIAIGNPAKLHSFDIANKEGTVVVECKCYTWTETGNVPSAKMGFINEAAFYLSFLDAQVDKTIVMSKSTHPKRDETLAEYYFRTNRHLLGKIKILEYDPISNDMRLVGQN
jgi:hypothetical protein